MQIVIDIPEDLYEETCIKVASDKSWGINSTKSDALIASGTPLPKGHGRLIDADDLWDAYQDLDYDFYEAMDVAKTILEADKEDKE